MNGVIELQKGGTYYYAAFFDKELSIPSINTYVYDGYDKTDGHLFIDAESYLETLSGKKSGGGHYLCFQEGEVEGMLDKRHLIEWLQDDHSPRLVGRTYEYKII